jgi:hypothetical protein
MSNTRPSKEIQQRRLDTRRSRKRGKRSTNHLDWKFWTATALGSLGLLIGIPALWLTIADRPTVSLGRQPDPNDPMSTQIIMTNDGVLPILNVSFDVFIKRAVTAHGLARFNDLRGPNYEVPSGILEPGEPKTTEMAKVFTSSDYRELDAALIAHFTPEWAPFWHRMRAFRFTIVRHTDGTAELQQIPAEAIEGDYRRLMQRDVAK